MECRNCGREVTEMEGPEAGPAAHIRFGFLTLCPECAAALGPEADEARGGGAADGTAPEALEEA